MDSGGLRTVHGQTAEEGGGAAGHGDPFGSGVLDLALPEVAAGLVLGRDARAAAPGDADPLHTRVGSGAQDQAASGGPLDDEVLDGHGGAGGDHDAVVGDRVHAQAAQAGGRVLVDHDGGLGGPRDRAVADVSGASAGGVDPVGSGVADGAPTDLGGALVVDDDAAGADVLDHAVLDHADLFGGDDDAGALAAAHRAAPQRQGPAVPGEHRGPGGPLDLAVGQFDLSGGDVDHRGLLVAAAQDETGELDRLGHRGDGGTGGAQDLDGPGAVGRHQRHHAREHELFVVAARGQGQDGTVTGAGEGFADGAELGSARGVDRAHVTVHRLSSSFLCPRAGAARGLFLLCRSGVTGDYSSISGTRSRPPRWAAAGPRLPRGWRPGCVRAA